MQYRASIAAIQTIIIVLMCNTSWDILTDMLGCGIFVRISLGIGTVFASTNARLSKLKTESEIEQTIKRATTNVGLHLSFLTHRIVKMDGLLNRTNSLRGYVRSVSVHKMTSRPIGVIIIIITNQGIVKCGARTMVLLPVQLVR